MNKKHSEIARRYAGAVFELALENGKAHLVDVVKEFEKVTKYFPIVENALVDHFVSDEVKNEVLRIFVDTLELSTIPKNFLRLLLKNNRIKFYREIIKNLAQNVDEYMGICRADIYAAHPLKPEIITEFEEMLSDKLRKKVLLAPKLDEALIAGYVFKMGNTVIDASLKTRLQQLGETLARGV